MFTHSHTHNRQENKTPWAEQADVEMNQKKLLINKECIIRNKKLTGQILKEIR